ncbi:DUF3868 domain-containing protein [Parabacteroides sp. AM08-6]|uniref:DUF3868 domain-containing protein n=1 Tax=Parabacteroides sp. AM08-6 TaxID=2292053 RepID=UPI000EFDF4B3|nr:DUF3868 domain-containing protein [Parabacteroides sp. AM08-6]RHJ86448.1 DUF3868 domain-containing protein [Parabacteroides sp. AM08-6]
MKMNIKLYVAAALLLVIAPATQAQSANSPVKVVCNELKQQGKELVIDAVITIDGEQIKSRESLSLTPVLESASQKEGLPSVLINGRISQKVYDREVALNNLKDDEPRFLVMKAVKGVTVVNYKKTIPFEAWMKDARFVLVPNMCGCGNTEVGEPLLISDKVLTRPDKRYEVHPALAYITPEAETVKHRAEVGTAYLDFQVGKYVILPDFRNNAAELAKIDNTIHTIVNDKNITLEGILLKGFASPEGSYKSNTALAGNRVKALAGYIRKQHAFKESLFTLENGSEDWEGLKAKVEADANVPSRSSVLAIINSDEDPDKKDVQLAKLDGGAPYQYVLKNIYPSLRRSDYRVNYTVREFTVEEGREIIKTRPQQLSLSEMFAVANSYEVGSKEYNDVFEIAVRMFSDDPVANLNAANIAMSKNDLSAARSYLAKAGNSPQAIHARGVLNLIEGNLGEAEKYLKQAKSAGVKEADANLEELHKKQEDNALFDSFN